MRFMDMVMDEVMTAAGNDMAVLVKMNMRDGSVAEWSWRNRYRWHADYSSREPMLWS